ncbi:serine/threonine protein kinase [Lentzea alba]|uniref:serine/threonine-protein kinase n=1 Tax=Lentzea alba TaxID=2714351 RepID=UPI0039BF9FBE
MALAPLQDDDPRRIGDHRLVGRLGAGGMGVVYLAHAADNSLVAIKQVRADLADDAFRARFQREASTLTRVQGEFTANVLAVETEETPPYLVLEYVDGPSLADYVDRSGPLPPEALFGFAVGLAAALRAVHREGVVHRDLKPANVLLAETGPKLIDFGIAQFTDSTRLTKTGLAVGTPGFMAPEQLTGTAGRPADVYSWALTVAYAGTGRPPFGVGPLEAVHYRLLNTSPDLAGMPEDLMPVLTSATSRDPQARPTAQELLSTLTGERPTRSDDAVRQVVQRTWLQTRVSEPPRKRRRPVLVAAASALLVLVLVAAGIYFAGRPSQVQSHQQTSPTTTTPTTTTTTTLPATRVLTYQPWAPEGLAPNVAVSSVESGSCTSGSSMALRREAFRCTVGNMLHDPCFASPFTQDVVACPDLTPDRVTMINLTEPLPFDLVMAPQEPRAWLLELADGQRCNAAGGATTTVGDLRLNFHCQNGFVYGDPDPASRLWTVHYQANGSNIMESVPVAVVYQ